MDILVIGGGGREHALCWRLAQSASCEKLYCAPGNPGIADVADCHAVSVDDIAGLVALAKKLKPDLVVVGPEAPLVAGLADALRTEGFAVFGPSKAAAQLEGSKAFLKDFFARHNLPTAEYKTFTDADAACAYIDAKGAPIVVKTSGLAAGKGVTVAMSVGEAKQAARDMLSGAAFGDAGKTIVIEEFLEGEEISYFAICSGTEFLPLGSAQDHKRVGDGDTGPNTGGMGAYSPARLMTPAMEKLVNETIIAPTLKGMADEGNPFSGVLFAGLMVTPQGPKLLEYNVRFGDPECQTLMMRLEGDFAAMLMAAAQGKLAEAKAGFSMSVNPSLCVVMAAQGYPGTYKKGTIIRGLEDAAGKGAHVFHAGTKRDADKHIVADGGRVLGITATAPDLKAARTIAYGAVDRILWPEGFCRRDIGWRALSEDKAA
ncbi:MAG: phosphoribosylamine--glycine ligase [Alphaproteobacteria bacterium]|nr:phosphoribosylamine--glycine ligase [Alphaproteobacteria bacterium]